MSKLKTLREARASVFKQIDIQRTAYRHGVRH